MSFLQYAAVEGNLRTPRAICFLPVRQTQFVDRADGIFMMNSLVGLAPIAKPCPAFCPLIEVFRASHCYAIVKTRSDVQLAQAHLIPGESVAGNKAVVQD